MFCWIFPGTDVYCGEGVEVASSCVHFLRIGKLLWCDCVTQSLKTQRGNYFNHIHIRNVYTRTLMCNTSSKLKCVCIARMLLCVCAHYCCVSLITEGGSLFDLARMLRDTLDTPTANSNPQENPLHHKGPLLNKYLPKLPSCHINI